jgi:hypothetical protein
MADPAITVSFFHKPLPFCFNIPVYANKPVPGKAKTNNLSRIVPLKYEKRAAPDSGQPFYFAALAELIIHCL